MKDGFRVIDADRHIIEPSDLWDRYMDPAFKGRVQITGPGQAGRFVDGKPVSDAVLLPRDDRNSDVIFAGSMNYDKAFGDALKNGFDPASNLRDMDREGVDVAVCVHGGDRTILPQAGSDRYSAFGRHVACHPMEQMLACLNLCGDGVLERFPALKAAYLESGAGWAPFWLERMDEHWEHYS